MKKTYNEFNCVKWYSFNGVYNQTQVVLSIHIWRINRWRISPWIHFLSINRKFYCKGYQIYFKILRKICKSKANLGFFWVIKYCSKFCIYLIKNFLETLCWWFLVPRLFEFIINGFKTFCASILACSFRSFIVLCCYLIWYISDVGSSEWHSIHNSIFRYSWSVFWLICFLYLNCSDCSCSDYTEVSDSSTLVIF